MQNFKTYTDNEQLNTAVMGILDSLKTTLSNSSGTAFPTTNLQAGMFCYRTDLNALYILKDVAINEWVKTIDFANPFGNAQTAQTAQTAISATSANSATIADKLKTARTISLNGGVTGACSFDGSADVAMQVANLDATKLSGVATINTTGNASTADKLSIARKINGVAFDGSADVAIPSGIPIGTERMIGYKEIDAGDIPLTGGLHSRQAYADLWDWVQTKPSMLKTESEWQAIYTANGGRGVPFYSTGDNSTTFRVPLKDVWMCGASSIGDIGKYYGDAIRNITGSMPIDDTVKNNATIRSYYDGVFNINQANAVSYDNTANTTASGVGGKLIFDASTIVPTSDENRPKTIVQLWVVKAFGTVSNVGNVDVSALASGLTLVESKLNNAESKLNNLNFTIIYPNGGTQASPANVTVNTRYVMANPFGNADVIVVAEVFDTATNQWSAVSSGRANIDPNTAATYGVFACQISNNIVVQTGQAALYDKTSSWMPNGFGLSLSGKVTTAPCRVKVWRCGN